MAITKSLDIGAVASATSVSVKQKNQNNAANLRPEKIVVIGQQSTSSATANNELYLASGNPDDAGVLFGFGSPLHRMAKKLFPKAGNGSKVETYFLPVAAPTTSTAEVKKIAATVATNVTKTFNGYLLLKDMIFEAAADVAGKVATIYHNNPAKAPRGTDLNSYETKSIPFTIIKGMTAEETIEALVSALEDYVEVPFKSKTYLAVQYGEGLISKKIRKYSKQYAPNSKKIPTHVLALVFEEETWFIYESHARALKEFAIAAGVRRFPVDEWKIVEKDTQEQFMAYELEIDKEELKKHIGEPYSVGDIRSLFFAALFHNNGKQKDRNGLICSEYMALCYPKICEFYGLPAWCITPAHFQDYVENVLEVA